MGACRRVGEADCGRAEEYHQGATERKCAVGGADGRAMECGSDLASTVADEEGAGAQWFLTPLSPPGS